jgi:hypothetical protein
MVKRFQFGAFFFFFQCTAFTSPEADIDNSCLKEPAATDIYRDLFVSEHLPLHGIE